MITARLALIFIAITLGSIFFIGCGGEKEPETVNEVYITDGELVMEDNVKPEIKLLEDIFIKPGKSRDFAEIKKSGVLRAVTQYSSTGYFLYRGQPMGFEFELLVKLAEYLGL